MYIQSGGNVHLVRPLWEIRRALNDREISRLHNFPEKFQMIGIASAHFTRERREGNLINDI